MTEKIEKSSPDDELYLLNSTHKVLITYDEALEYMRSKIEVKEIK